MDVFFDISGTPAQNLPEALPLNRKGEPGSNVPTVTYTRGTDLSGSLQGRSGTLWSANVTRFSSGCPCDNSSRAREVISGLSEKCKTDIVEG